MASQERSLAQGQCYKFLNLLGFAEKHRDGINIRCPNCSHYEAMCTRCKRRYVKLIEHTQKGVSDYIGNIKQSAKFNDYPLPPLGIAVEVKDGDHRFAFPDISRDQWKWAKNVWCEKTGNPVWFWILMGTGRAGSKNTDYPRATFLIPSDELWETRILMWKSARLKGMPLNELAAESRNATRDNHLYAESLWKRFRCNWQGDGYWLPNSNHPFYQIYGVSYDGLSDRIQSTISRARDSASIAGATPVSVSSERE